MVDFLQVRAVPKRQNQHFAHTSSLTARLLLNGWHVICDAMLSAKANKHGHHHPCLLPKIQNNCESRFSSSREFWTTLFTANFLSNRCMCELASLQLTPMLMLLLLQGQVQRQVEFSCLGLFKNTAQQLKLHGAATRTTSNC